MESALDIFAHCAATQTSIDDDKPATDQDQNSIDKEKVEEESGCN